MIKVISGGQTGADQAGLLSATALGIPTGGWAAKGWLTESGPAPWLADFGLKECPTPGYPDRTRLNVRDSDGTVVFGQPQSTGSRLTINCAVLLQKPNLIFDLALWHDKPLMARTFQEWVSRHRIAVLNVAGNRESVLPGIQETVCEFLMENLSV